ncbi:MAG TPA: glycosyltransferase family 4 protein [Kineosporiaceae bacterium]|nr:glycosyltransferase family 4 protein [Kineosporiaceae bacterium]
MPVARVVISIYDHAGNPHYGGGGSVVVRELAGRLARRHRVTVICGSYPGCRARRRAEPPPAGVRQVFLPVGRLGPRLGQLLYHAVLPLQAALRRYDVWVESFTPPWSTSLLPLVTRRPVIGLAQMLAGADAARRYRLPFDRVERHGLRRYRTVVVLNPADAHTVAAVSPRTTVIRQVNGVRLPERVSSDGGGEGVLFLGRVDVGQKGLDLLLRAYLRSLDTHPGPGDAPTTGPAFPLLIAGSGTPDQERALEQELDRVRRADPRARVHRLGRVDGDRKDELLRGCAVLVMPSRFETFGLSALEGMAYGKPVLVFDLPQLAWIPAGAAVRVPALDVEALAMALRRLAGDRALRARLGRAGREAAAAYGWDRVTEDYEALLAEALRGRSR